MTWRAGIVAGWLLLGSGCGTLRIESQATAGDAAEEHKVNRWLWGLITPEVATERQAAMTRVEVRDTLADKLLTFFSAGVYSPTTVWVWFGGDEGSPDR